MKNLFLLLAFMAVSQMASAQTLTFEVTNNTNFLLHGLYISPNDKADDWSEDLLEVTFDPGVVATITIPADYYPEDCNFKFKVSYITNGKTYYEVLCYADACNNGAVTIEKYDAYTNGHWMYCQY